MQIRNAAVLTLILLVPALSAIGEERTLTAHSESMYHGIRKIVLAAAERTPEAQYGFRPVESVRTFGQIVGHIADSQYLFCSMTRGDKNPGLQIEKTRSSKADLVAALREAFSYCESTYAALDDVSGKALVKALGKERPKLGVLETNQVHTIEHYGNLVTYMRIQGLVPPTSDPEFMKSLR